MTTKQKASEIDIKSFDLNTFLLRPDVVEAVGSDEYLLFLFTGSVKRREFTRQDTPNVMGLKKKFVHWETTSHGFDYGCGFMSLELSIRRVIGSSDDNPLYTAKLYFNSHDDSDFSIRSPVLSLVKVQRAYDKLLYVYRSLDRVPTYEDAMKIAERNGCYVDG